MKYLLGTLLLWSACAVSLAAPPPEAATCQACHGARGEGMVDGGKPRLAGQSAHYLNKQLQDFASGARDSAIMSAIARGLNDQTRSRLATYYASLPVPADVEHTAPTAAQAGRGHQLAIEGAEGKRVQACNNCHGPDGSGVPLSAPALAGQLAAYMTAQLQAFQQGGRKNDAGTLMRSVASRLDAADIDAVASYYASIPSSH